MSGEYFVAAQLQRLQVGASLTYGNAKSADVVAFAERSDRSVVIEVKTTKQPRWVVGGRVPESSQKPWVFVHLPKGDYDAPSFYVLTQKQLHEILAPIDAEYERKYKDKHGVEYGDKAGVVNVTREQLKPFENNWDIILKLLRSCPAAQADLRRQAFARGATRTLDA